MKKKIVEFLKKENKKKIIVIAVVVVIVVIGGIVAVRFGHKGGSDKNVVYVNKVEDIINPSMTSGRVNRFSGVVETQKEIKIQPEQDRAIEKILVKVGDKVEVGTVLFTYANQETQDKLDQAKIDLERISNKITLKQKEISAISDNLDKLEAQGELKKSELELKAKNIEIEKLTEALSNVEFKSELAGVVKELNQEGEHDNNTGKEKPFMSIISLGNYRIKGKINEQNVYDITPGQEVLIHSRIDENVTWKGTISEINTGEPQGNQNDSMGGDGITSSNSYPFYVDLITYEGLMLGQHVYIEPDHGQKKEKEGIWLDAAYVLQEKDNAFVWADNGHGKLEKRKVTLGDFDEEMYLYNIKKGLTEEDFITYNETGLTEKMKTKPGNNKMSGMSNPSEQDMPDKEKLEDEKADEEITEYDNQAENTEKM